MADSTRPVDRHYGLGGLMDRIEAGLARAGVRLSDVTVDDLAPIDAFRDYFERYDVRTIVSRIRNVQVWQATGHSRVLAELGFERAYLDRKTVVLRR